MKRGPAPAHDRSAGNPPPAFRSEIGPVGRTAVITELDGVLRSRAGVRGRDRLDGRCRDDEHEDRGEVGERRPPSDAGPQRQPARRRRRRRPAIRAAAAARMGGGGRASGRVRVPTRSALAPSTPPITRSPSRRVRRSAGKRKRASRNGADRTRALLAAIDMTSPRRSVQCRVGPAARRQRGALPCRSARRRA